ncbi:PopZ family protein [Rhizobium sp. L1K21]|uniref:PopZ family protein n=1 Tax=Rhizobium sp. L1K21 TaxID=2954933 RepID=UPI002092A2B7|nr:DUF2497 domain-containing protein [Rhizobium sp. L1K21]MCO6186314.1 DUF2497 domain-containing protein [Rhizobium sp. L1K21]
MAQPSVAREPSMEEILASIRRIIESNEPDNIQPSEAVAAPEPENQETAEPQSYEATISAPAAELSVVNDEDDGDIHLTVDETFEVEPEQAEEQPQVQAAPVSEPQPAAKPSTLADVAARVRSHAEIAKAAPQSMATSSPLTTSRMQGLPAGSTPAKPAQAQTAPAAPAPENTGGQGNAVAKLETKLQHIVSEATEDKVARSFDELAAALHAEPQRSLDEIAEEMLRPMLREWLDDNLPSLVERLVREEIERVARGPRG